MKINLSKTKLTLGVFVTLVASFLFIGQASATVTPDVNFAPSTNWYEWVIRYLNETGRGQIFKTSANATGIRSVAMKLCRTGTFTKPKTVTLCTSAVTGWYGGCQTPLASKTFTSSTLSILAIETSSNKPIE